MITLKEYFGAWWSHPDHTPEADTNAHSLLAAVANLGREMLTAGVVFPVNRKTGSIISGLLYGGFRPQSCHEGAPNSAHKQGLAVNIFDPRNEIDAWIMAHQDALKRHGLYIEHPDKTVGWSHWTLRAPQSGKRIFYP